MRVDTIYEMEGEKGRVNVREGRRGTMIEYRIKNRIGKKKKKTGKKGKLYEYINKINRKGGVWEAEGGR